MTFSELWQRVWSGRAQPPSPVEIPSEHVLGAPAGKLIRRDQDYFQVRVNQLFLTAEREGPTRVDPMVVSLCEFAYEGSRVSVPFVVGPGRLKGLAVAEPHGMLYRDTRIAGLHPYSGGIVSVAVVLCQIPTDDPASRWLRVIEKAAHSFDFATMLVPYVRMGQALLDGVEQLLGVTATQPLLGWQRQFDPDANIPLRSGFFALIGAPAVDPSTLWVRNNELYVGSTGPETTFREFDFLLFSMTTPADNRRTDLTELPFYPLWQRVMKEALVTSEDGKRSLQANLAALEQSILLSPDLTPGQADALADEYYGKAVAQRERARERALRQTTRDGGTDVDQHNSARKRSLRAFDLS